MTVANTHRPIFVLGAGGHAKVVICTIKAFGARIDGLVDPDPETHGRKVLGVPVIGGEEKIESRSAEQITLVNGVGSTGDTGSRRDIFDRYRDRGFTFFPIIHPAAIVGEDVNIGDGAQVMAGAIIQPGCRIGVNAIINTGAQIDHDCSIAEHAHVAPGAVLGGTVKVGAGTHIGAGATVIQNITIGDGCLIGAGAVVTQNVADGLRVAGNPAK